MARKTRTVVIPSTGDGENRDAGKAFLITEMPAMQAEAWATRALMAMAAGGVDIPPEVIKMGVGAVLAAGFRALVTMAYADAKPLLDEMMQCARIVPDTKRLDITRPLDEEDVEEVATLLTLRSEIVEVHTGFSIAGFLSSMGKTASTTTPDLSDTQTSDKLSEPA